MTKSTLSKLVQDVTDRIVHIVSSLITHAESSLIARGHQKNRSLDALTILRGTGEYKYATRKVLVDVLTENEKQLVVDALSKNKPISAGLFHAAAINEPHGELVVFILKNAPDITRLGSDIVKLLHSSIDLAYKNIILHQNIETTQAAIIFKLGDIIEVRSGETGNHVRRVSEYTRLLATLHGLDEDSADGLKLAATMHDIGKIGISDTILLKPTSLTPEEFNIIKQHTNIGYNLLHGGHDVLFETAAVIAYTHHEKWDGNGYPRGLSHDDIPLYGRIVAISDVYDALSHTRCYKQKWDPLRIQQHFETQMGRHFDPILTTHFLSNFAAFQDINTRFSTQDAT